MKPGFSTKIRQEALPQRPATGLPGPGRLLHEPRAVLAGGCAYCTNPRTPRSTPNPSPVAPDPRALRPGEVGTPRERPRPSTNKPPAAELLPRARVAGICGDLAGLLQIRLHAGGEPTRVGGGDGWRQASRTTGRPQAAQPPGAVRAARCRAAGGRPPRPRADLRGGRQEVRCDAEHSRQVRPADPA